MNNITKSKIKNIRFVYTGKVVAKPRLTQGDKRKYNPRPVVARWLVYKEHLQLVARSAGYRDYMPIESIIITAYLTGTKKETAPGPHRSKPDADNILKGVLDALTKNDSCVWNMSIAKFVKTREQEMLQINLQVIDIKDEIKEIEESC